jgi:hypothetical protein
VHNGDFASSKAVEERGFPDIGATDDGDSWHDGRRVRVVGRF